MAKKIKPTPDLSKVTAQQWITLRLLLVIGTYADRTHALLSPDLYKVMDQLTDELGTPLFIAALDALRASEDVVAYKEVVAAREKAEKQKWVDWAEKNKLVPPAPEEVCDVG